MPVPVSLHRTALPETVAASTFPTRIPYRVACTVFSDTVIMSASMISMPDPVPSAILFPATITPDISFPITPVESSSPLMVLSVMRAAFTLSRDTPAPSYWQPKSFPAASSPSVSHAYIPRYISGPNEESSTVIFSEEEIHTPSLSTLSAVTFSTYMSRQKRRVIPSPRASVVVSRMVMSVQFTQMTAPAFEEASMISPDTPSR